MAGNWCAITPSRIPDRHTSPELFSASDKTILIVGTYDTKYDELEYMAGRIKSLGCKVLTMDVSVLGDPLIAANFSKYDVAAAANCSIQKVITSGDENTAMQIMATGFPYQILRTD